jgi:putative hydrolase of the HAD superfamily
VRRVIDAVASLDGSGTRLRAAGHRLYYLSNMPAGKPDEAIFRLALQRFGERAEDCIFLDDHPANVAVACQLGLKAVQFRDAAQAEADVAALG